MVFLSHDSESAIFHVPMVIEGRGFGKKEQGHGIVGNVKNDQRRFNRVI